MSKLSSKSLYFCSPQQPRILVISMRGYHAEAFRSANYEFEDNICAFDNADLLAPTPASNLFPEVNKKVANFVGRTIGMGKLFQSGSRPIILDREYDLLFFICQHFWDITLINSIKGWREKCRKAVLWIDEIWVKELRESKTRLCFELTQEFDCIFTTHSASVDALACLTRRPCYFLSFAVDTIKFCPYPYLPQRFINVYSIGRCSAVVHKALLEKAERENFLYLYDSLKGLEMKEYQEHRTLYSNLIKRSRYFIANKAKFDAIHQTGGQQELGARFFEGVAGGAVIIGSVPACDAYKSYFDWSDAVLEIPEDTARITEIITELDAQPARLQAIHRNNVVHSLLRHDWVYRWEKILEKVELDSTSEMLLRKERLRSLAERVNAS
ncbi:glycosyltransferase [Scytonema sp. UIC 10036]|uniref:glycosyltransferase n=1 Tax=Scytonema sp. UIC 10036 TaxID=2304196 RepID=UPI0012DA8431|nr:glycosyltransferase [Scytonema sp. UIC 10036]MUG96874.1 glycosyltransferase [Scytonema sp. UIC 10036]